MHTHKFQSEWIWGLPLCLEAAIVLTPSWMRLGVARKGVPVNTRVQGFRTDSVIVGSSLTLYKQLRVARVHTCLRKNEKDWRAKALVRDLNFTIQEKRVANAGCKLGSWAPGTLHPGEPSAKITRRTIEHLLL